MKENNYTVYVHISPNVKYYVGITSQNPEYRWRNGKGYHHNKYFTNAINKYGWDNFQHEIIASNLSKEEAQSFEILLIKELNSLDRRFGYNCSSGGECGNNFEGKTTEEMKTISKKMSENHADISGENNPMYDVHRFGNDNPFYGKNHNKETKIKMSKNHADFKGKNHPQYGKPKSEETKRKISESRTGINNPMSKSVLCITTNKIFTTINEASEYYSIHSSNITMCCRGKVKSAGKHPTTNEKLKWQYYEDYIKEKESEVA